MAKNTGDQNLDPFFYVEFAGCRQKSKVYKGVSCKVWCRFLCFYGFNIFQIDTVYKKGEHIQSVNIQSVHSPFLFEIQIEKDVVNFNPLEIDAKIDWFSGDVK